VFASDQDYAQYYQQKATTSRTNQTRLMTITKQLTVHKAACLKALNEVPKLLLELYVLRRVMMAKRNKASRVEATKKKRADEARRAADNRAEIRRRELEQMTEDMDSYYLGDLDMGQLAKPVQLQSPFKSLFKPPFKSQPRAPADEKEEGIDLGGEDEDALDKAEDEAIGRSQREQEKKFKRLHKNDRLQKKNKVSGSDEDSGSSADEVAAHLSKLSTVPSACSILNSLVV